MIDFKHIEKYKENNRIEAKKALGGLPHSIWETYSAFANTFGGIILLGVEEHRDKSLHPVALPDPQMLIEDFWDIVENTNKVSANILSDKDVSIEEIDGKRIVAIRIPRAHRHDRPIYIDGNPFLGSYRRNGEGDYKCTADEVESMLRDAKIKSEDMAVLGDIELDALSHQSIKLYCEHMDIWHTSHISDHSNDVDFLYKMGAIGKDKSGKMRPTAAGLLMFGYESEITKIFPHYHLEYIEQIDADRDHTITSSSGDWSGNVCDFFFHIYDRLSKKAENLSEHNDVAVFGALREALVNCLVNADYHGRQGIVITLKKDLITFSNPGSFRIDVETAKSGGISDPRNSGLIDMFKLLGVGEGSGSGIPNIYRVWKNRGWSAPIITESFDPDRITLSLPFGKTEPSVTVTKTSRQRSQLQKQAIVTYLTEKITAKTSDIAQLLGVSPARARRLLCEMVAEEIIVTEGKVNRKTYKLKA